MIPSAWKHRWCRRCPPSGCRDEGTGTCGPLGQRARSKPSRHGLSHDENQNLENLRHGKQNFGMASEYVVLSPGPGLEDLGSTFPFFLRCCRCCHPVALDFTGNLNTAWPSVVIKVIISFWSQKSSDPCTTQRRWTSVAEFDHKYCSPCNKAYNISQFS